jgi:hypothetical protein
LLLKKDGFCRPFFVLVWGFGRNTLTFRGFAAYWQTVQSQNWHLGLSMKHTLLFSTIGSTLLVLACGSASAQIFRCTDGNGTEYINNAKDALTRGCKTMQGGNVTVVQATPIQKAAPVRIASASPSSPSSSGGPEQKARDSDSRSILESELKKAEAKLAEQQKEFNNGEPEKQGIEGRNYQRYLDRVAELKDSIARNVSDIAGLKREISRLPNNN